MKQVLGLFFLLLALPMMAQDAKLTGTVIGTERSVDYSTNKESTNVNTRDCAFDGNLNTYFASYDRSYTWVGLDLGTPHIITRVGWSPRNDGVGPDRVQLAGFQGANSPDFSDALPLFVVPDKGTIGQISYANVNVSLGFRYVRYVGPNNARCNVAEVEFYGHEGVGDTTHLYQVTALPTVCIYTENAQEPYDKEHQLEGIVSIISDAGTCLLQDSATSRLRGNASIQFPKKPYQIKFHKKQQVPGATVKAKKWTLVNNYGDKTLMRNLVAFYIDRQLGAAYTPFARPVDVILNGEYKGTYQLCDKVEIGTGRIDIKEMKETDVSGDKLTGGYHLEIDGYYYDEPHWFKTTKNIPITIQSPDEDVIQQAQINYIRNAFQDLENTLWDNAHWRDSIQGYRSKMNLRSFLIHFLTNQLAANPDNYWSCNIYKPRNDVFYFGPVWDFDIAFHNDNRRSDQNNASSWIYGSADGASTFPNRVMNDPEAMTELRHLYAEARDEGRITAEGLAAYIDSLALLMDESQQLNFIHWPILNQQVHMNYTARGSYKAEVDFLRDWMIRRVAWMDRKLNYKPKGTDLDVIDAEWNDNQPYDVYTLQGVCVVQQVSELPALPTGIYLLKQGTTTKKIIL